MPRELQLPYGFTPRPYQIPILRAMDSGIKRAVWVAHRRSGKDKTCLNFIAKKMQEVVGTYFYLFPTFSQAKKVIWEGRDADGFKFIDHFPRELLDGFPNETELKIKYKNGSMFQLIGTDAIDRVVGTNPIGVVFSEFSLQNPEAWSFLRPILAENGGWAIFVGTPRGENHFHDVYNLAMSDPSNWFAEILTAYDTKAIPQEILDRERREIMRLQGNDALFQQEYLCSFTVPLAGAYYAEHIQRAYAGGRVTEVPIDPRYRVDTWWDLGKGDNMAVCLVQQVGIKIHFVDYLFGVGKGMVDFIPVLNQKAKDHNFIFGRHIGPHDINGTEIFAGKTRAESAAGLGFQFEAAPKIAVQDGIDAVRNIFDRFWFDKERCADLLNALKSYEKVYDDKLKTFRNEPLHNWASHPADAVRTGAVAIDFNESGRTIAGDGYEETTPARRFSPMAA